MAKKKQDDGIFTRDHEALYAQWCDGLKSLDELIGCFQPVLDKGEKLSEKERGLSPPLGSWLRKGGVQEADLLEVLNEIFRKLARVKRNNSSIALLIDIAKAA